MFQNLFERKRTENNERALQQYYDLELHTFFNLESNISNQIDRFQSRFDILPILLKNILEKCNQNNLWLRVFNSYKFRFNDAQKEKIAKIVVRYQKEQVSEDQVFEYLFYSLDIFTVMKEAITMLLFSYDFQFDIEDMNVHVPIFDEKILEDIFNDQISSIKANDLETLLKSLLDEKLKDSKECLDSRNPKFHTIFNNLKSAFKNFAILLYVSSYKQLTLKCSLDKICKTLNKLSLLGLYQNVLSKSILKQFLYHYAKVDLKCKLTKLFNQNETIPLILYSSSQTPLNKQPDIKFNDFFELFIEDKISVLSVSIESANTQKVGKSELLNDLFYTRFEVNGNDAFRSKQVELDLNEWLHPTRELAIIDCNVQHFEFFSKILKMMNVVLISILFEDLIDRFDEVKQKLQRIRNECEANQVKAIIIIRDWNHYNAFCFNKNANQQSVKIESENGNQENININNQVCQELTQYIDFIKDQKNSFRQEHYISTEKNYSKKAEVREKLKKEVLFQDTENWGIIKLENFQSINEERKKKKIKPLQKKINQIIAMQNKAKRFNQNKFQEIRHSIVSNEDQTLQKTKENLAKLIQNFYKFYSESEEVCFSFNSLWNEKNEYFQKLLKTDSQKVLEKLTIETKISSIEDQINQKQITEMLECFVYIFCDEQNPFTLIYFYERFLKRELKLSKSQNTNILFTNQDRSIFNIDHYWRNIKIFLENERNDLSPQTKEKLLANLENLYIKGYGFELIDGDHYIYQGSLLDLFSKRFRPDDNIMTVSVKGPQSSGKSTLINLQYGTEFKTGVGKCTAGITGYFMKLEQNFEDYKAALLNKNKSRKDACNYLMFLDSQGLLSLEVNDSDMDRKIATYLLGISKVILINFSQDLSEGFKNLLKISNFTYQKLDLGAYDLFNNEPDQAPGVLDPAFQANQFKQKMLFISNQNYNCGSISDKQRQQKDISSHVQDIKITIDKLIPEKRILSNVLDHRPANIQILENALKSEAIEKDTDFGINSNFEKKWFDPAFVADLSALKKQTINSLVEINESNVPDKFSFKKFGNYLKNIWNEIYYNFEFYDLQNTQNLLIMQEYETQVSKYLESHKQKYLLDKDDIFKQLKSLLNQTILNQENNHLQIIQIPMNQNVINQIFPQQPELVQFIEKVYTNQQCVFENMNDIFRKYLIEDYNSIKNFFETQLESLKNNELTTWVESKRLNSNDFIREGSNWKLEDLLRIFDKKSKALGFYNGVLILNYIFLIKKRFNSALFSHANLTITNTILNLTGDIEENKVYLQKNFKNELESQISKYGIHLHHTHFKDDNHIFFDYIKRCFCDIFSGLFGHKYEHTSLDYWNHDDFCSKALLYLDQIQDRLIEINEKYLKKVDPDLERRFKNESYFNLYKKYPKTIDQLINLILNISDGNLECLTRIINDLNQSQLLTSLNFNLPDTLNLGIRQKEHWKKILKARLEQHSEWNKQKLFDSSLVKIFIKHRLFEIDVFLDQEIIIWNKSLIQKIRNHENGNQNKLQKQDLDLFFLPKRARSFQKLKDIFSVILNNCDYKQMLVKKIESGLQVFFEKYLCSEDPWHLFFVKSETLEKLKSEVIHPIIHSINTELKKHGATASSKLNESIIFLILTKIFSIYKDQLDAILKIQESNLTSVDKEKIYQNLKPKLITQEQKTYFENQLKDLAHKFQNDRKTKLEEKIWCFFNNKVNSFHQSLDKIDFIKEVDREFLKKLKRPEYESQYEEVMEYYRRQEKVLKNYFDDKYDAELRLLNNNETIQKIKIEENTIINDAIKYLESLSQFLKKKGVSTYQKFIKVKQYVDTDQIDIENEDTFDSNNQKEKKFHFEIKKEGLFKFHILKQIIQNPNSQNFDFKRTVEQDHFYLSKQIRFSNPFLVSPNQMISDILENQISIESFESFLQEMINILHRYQCLLHDSQLLGNHPISDNDLDEIICKIKDDFFGCTNKCPLCKRIC